MSEDKRMKLFGKDKWVNDKKKNKKLQNPKHKFNKNKHENTNVNVTKAKKPRKASSISENSYKNNKCKSFTPEEEEYDYL